MEETEEKKKKTTSGFTEDISKEMSNSNPLPVEDAFSNLHQCYVSISGHTRIFTATKYGKRFMLKCLKNDFLYTPIYRQALAKEFEIGQQLEHPNICRTIDLEKVDNLGTVVVMEYIDGDNLEQLIKKNALSAELARKIAGQLMDALEYMHNKQMIHRDLKPSNIMITHNGQNVKLIDFGLSDSDSFCVLKSPAGTSGYIAPEQMLPAAKAEPRADIYSLGMVLGDMAKATGDKALSKMAEICSCRDPQSRPQNIAQLRQRLSCTPRYRHALLLLCALIIALLAALAVSYYHLEKNAQEPASSASDSIQPNDNKVIDYQLWDK